MHSTPGLVKSVEEVLARVDEMEVFPAAAIEWF